MKLQAYYENKKHFASALNTPYLLRSNLQFFSDPGGAGGDGGDGGNGAGGDGGAAGTGPEGGDGGENKLSFTQEEYDKKLQEGIATELEKQKETWRKELEETMKKERKEAEELAKLSAEERAKVEQEKAKLKLDEEKAALDKEKLDFQREKLFLQTEKILSEEKLDTRLAPFLIGEDADSTHKNIQLYKEVHKEAVQNEVADVLKGKKQLVGGGANLSEIEQLEQQRLEALQKRDMPRAIALKNQIFNLQNK